MARSLHRTGIEGWFSTHGRDGDRTIDQQLLGLDPLFDEVKGKTVLDIGCAEGLISLHLCTKFKAKSVHGVEIIASHVAVANSLRGENSNCTFERADANHFEPDVSTRINPRTGAHQYFASVTADSPGV